MSDITCDYCGESGEWMMFMRGQQADGTQKSACESCFAKILKGEFEGLGLIPPFISTPLGEVPIDKQRP
jgi:hypothetical protein